MLLLAAYRAVGSTLSREGAIQFPSKLILHSPIRDFTCGTDVKLFPESARCWESMSSWSFRVSTLCKH